MTDAPERIWIDNFRDTDDGMICAGGEHRLSVGGIEYVLATALDAAEARIEALQDTLNIERALSDGAHRRAKAARFEAYTECAAIADDWFARSGHGSPGDEIRATLEALEKGDNHGNG